MEASFEQEKPEEGMSYSEVGVSFSFYPSQIRTLVRMAAVDIGKKW